MQIGERERERERERQTDREREMQGLEEVTEGSTKRNKT